MSIHRARTLSVMVLFVPLSLLGSGVGAAEAVEFDPFGQNKAETDVLADYAVDEGPVIPEIQFANSDISMAFQIISDATGWSIFPTEQVSRAKISLWARDITAKELLEKVVTLAGFVYHRRDEIISVMTFDEYMQYHGLAKRVVPLTYANAASVAAVIKPFLTKLGKMVVYGRTNAVVLYEADANIESVLAIIRKLDTPAEDIIVEVLNLKYADCESLAAVLQQAFGGRTNVVVSKNPADVTRTADSRVKDATQEQGTTDSSVAVPAGPVGIYAVGHANQLVVVGTKADVEKVRSVVAEIDVCGENMVLEVVDLRYADAEVVAGTLRQLFADAQTPESSKQNKQLARPSNTSTQELNRTLLQAREALSAPQAPVQVYSIGRTNQLIVKAFRGDLERLTGLVAKLDVFVEPTTKSYHFTYVDASAIYRGLESILDLYSRYGRSDSSGGPGAQGRYRKDSGLTLVERTNSILLTGPPSAHRIMSSIKDSVDVPGTYEAGLIKVYKIENADVDEIAATLKTMIETAKSQEGKPGEPKFEQTPEPAPEPAGPELTETELFVPQIEAKVSVNKATNSVVVLATERQHRELEALIKELDVRRKQVLIKAMIVEITTGDDMDLGVELDHIGSDALAFTSFGLSAIDPATGSRDIIVSPGATAAVLSPDSARAIVKALQSTGNARIESAPQILVNDNAVGSIQSIAEEPTTQTNLGETTTTTSFAGFVEAGTQFAITPHISRGNYLRVEYQIILNSFGSKPTDPSVPPPRSTSSIQSEATVPDGFTIVVGGLEAVNESTSIDKVPLLGDIPLIGMAFTNTMIRKQYITTYLFITPTIMKSDDFSDLKDATQKALEQIKTEGKSETTGGKTENL